ncbi:MAG TPA: CHAD domain-containing protein [Solirubrobacterales bacterium]
MSARSYRLMARESPSEGIRRIALGRAEKAIEELDRAGDGDGSADAIHAARKDLKKLRAVVRLVRTELGQDLYRAENRRYRDAGRLLARSRDAEVKVETLNALRESFGEELSAEMVAAWLAELERERDEIAKRVADEPDGSHVAEAKAAIEVGREKIVDWRLRDDSWQLVGSGLRRSYRDGRRAMQRTRAEPTTENVHEWRKRTKDLWYQLRILREAWRPVLGETAEQAHELTDLLGKHHDLALLTEDLEDREPTGDLGAAADAIERRRQELLDDAGDIGARLYAEKPKAFAKRMKSYWQVWR